MVIDSKDAALGTVLVIAAAPTGRRRTLDAASVLPDLAALPPGALSGRPEATVMELVDPADPQAVLSRLRTAAASPGPLVAFVVGQLLLDRRQHALHLALSRTTPANARSTALPWSWLAEDLGSRPASTTLVVDLVADDEAWRHIGERGVRPGRGTRLYGVIAPPPGRRTVRTPAYLKAFAAMLCSAEAPSPAQVHLHAAGLLESPGSVLLIAHEPEPVAHPSPPDTGVVAQSARADPDATTPTSEHEPVEGEAEQDGTQPPDLPPEPLAPILERADGATDGTDWSREPHGAILAAAREGRHAEAAAAAAVWEEAALRTHGPGSPQAIHWLEVRADLARLAADPVRSCELWMAAANNRLDRGQHADHPDVQGAVDRAHHEFEGIREREQARRLAPALVSLRMRVVGRQHEAVESLRRRVGRLHAAP